MENGGNGAIDSWFDLTWRSGLAWFVYLRNCAHKPNANIMLDYYCRKMDENENWKKLAVRCFFHEKIV